MQPNSGERILGLGKSDVKLIFLGFMYCFDKRKRSMVATYTTMTARFQNLVLRFC